MAPRTNQKERTRQALVDAAAALLDEGRADPTIDEVIERALVSRATFYRYFDSASDLMWQVFSDRSIPSVDETFGDAGHDIVERAARAEQAINDYLFGDADGTRAFERAVLERALNGTATDHDRTGRRLAYIDAVLEPIADRLSPADLVRVRHALALTMGSQVVSALLDTCKLDPETARDVTGFAARAIAAEATRLAGIHPPLVDSA